MRLWLALSSLALVVSLAGCIKATPVTPAPLAPARATELRNALVGRWFLVDEQKVGGERKSASGKTFLTFMADGRVHFQTSAGFITANQEYTFKLDGANIAGYLPGKDRRWLTFRANSWTDKTLELFIYDMSYTWFFRRE